MVAAEGIEPSDFAFKERRFYQQKLHGYKNKSFESSIERVINDMKDNIIKLRKEGKSYREIAKIVGCSKSTVCYYLDSSQTNKSAERTRKNRKKNPLYLKIDGFNRKAKKGLRNKIHCFSRKINGAKGLKDSWQFSLKDILNKYQQNSFCYLTGDKIDLNNPASYSFDHIVPFSRGGENTLDNLGLSTKEANQAKHDKIPEEFIALCIKVLKHHGYIISS